MRYLKKHAWLYAIAVVQALLLWLWSDRYGSEFEWLENLHSAFQDGVDMNQFRRWLPFPLLCLWPMTLCFLSGVSLRRRIKFGAGLFIFLLCLSLYHSWTDVPLYVMPVMILLCALILLLGLPFLQISDQIRQWRVPYLTYFHQACQNSILIAQGGFFFLVACLILALWANLFDLIGVRFFTHLFADSFFILLASACFAVAALTTKTAKRYADLLINWILLGAAVLLPLAAAVVALFLIFLPIQGLELLWQTTMATPLLLGIQFILLKLVNAAWRDGRYEPYPLWLGRAILVIVALSPILTAIAAYSTGLRIQEYGLTPARVYALAAIFIAGLFSIAYSFLIFTGQWKNRFARVNTLLILVAIGVATLLLTPIADPARLAASSQYDRLAVDGKHDLEDAIVAYRDFGRYGSDLIRRLRDRPAWTAHREALDTLLETPRLDIRWHQKEDVLYRDEADRIALLRSYPVYPAGAKVDDALLKTLSDNWWALSHTFKESGLIVMLDLSRDGTPEALLIGKAGDVEIYQLRRAVWRAVGSARLTALSPDGTLDLIARALDAHDFKTSVPELPELDDLSISGQTFKVNVHCCLEDDEADESGNR